MSASSPDVIDFMMINNRLSCKVVDAFDWIFASHHGLRLPKLWSNLYGFDIVKFDEWIECRENESTAEATVRQYGKIGQNLIKLLISSPEQMQAYLDSPEGQLDFSSQWESYKRGQLNFGQE